MAFIMIPTVATRQLPESGSLLRLLFSVLCPGFHWITSIIICFVLGGFLCFPTEPFFRAIQPLVYSSAFQLCSDHSQVLLFVSMPRILFSISLFSIAIGLNRDGSRKGDNDHHPCFFCTIIQPSANNLHIKNTHMRMCIKSTFRIQVDITHIHIGKCIQCTFICKY